MIISHKYKFIFIKTEKTAGTSIEIALSQYLGRDDVITPISKRDEQKRRELGYRGPQNFHVPLRYYSRSDVLRCLRRRRRLRFFNHAPARFIRPRVDPKVWSSYFKFCFERNPWDKVVSWYYWLYREEPRPPFTEFAQSPEASNIRGLDLYTVDSKVVVDRVFRFEELESEIGEVARLTGLPELPTLPRAKAGFRPDNRAYRTLMSPSDREHLARVHAQEIALFGYQF